MIQTVWHLAHQHLQPSNQRDDRGSRTQSSSNRSACWGCLSLEPWHKVQALVLVVQEPKSDGLSRKGLWQWLATGWSYYDRPRSIEGCGGYSLARDFTQNSGRLCRTGRVERGTCIFAKSILNAMCEDDCAVHVFDAFKIFWRHSRVRSHGEFPRSFRRNSAYKFWDVPGLGFDRRLSSTSTRASSMTQCRNFVPKIPPQKLQSFVWMVISTVLTKMLCTMHSFVQVGGYVIFDDVYTWRDAGVERFQAGSWNDGRVDVHRPLFCHLSKKPGTLNVDFTKMRPSRVLTSMDWCAADLRTHCQQKMIVRIFSLVGYITGLLLQFWDASPTNGWFPPILAVHKSPAGSVEPGSVHALWWISEPFICVHLQHARLGDVGGATILPWVNFGNLRLPSGYVKIAIENDHRNSGFSH